MGDFFHGWRRKIGVLTLVIAYVLMGALINSMYGTHAIGALCRGPENLEGFASIDRHFVWLKTAPANYDCSLLPEVPVRFPTYTRPKGNWAFGSQGFENHDIQWNWRIGGFGVGRLTLKNGTADWQVIFFTFSWWSIVIPLTMISAYLLLVKPRPKTSTKST